MEACKKFEEVLILLKLESYFPCKITLRHVLEAKLNDKIELGDIKWEILNKIINVDLRARDGVLADILDIIKKQDIVEGKKSEIKPNDPTQTEAPKNRTHKKKQLALFHPQDVFNAIYLCCSPFFKQLIVSKLFMCRIAVPVIISSTQLTAGFLWPFNFVNTDGTNSKGKVFEGFLSDQDIKIVSFIRLGETTFSKSTVLNKVLSKDPSFDTFYSQDSPMGSTSKRTLGGTVEASYFIPYGQTKTGSFDDAILFLNLRGDAAQYQLQLDVIKSVSNIVVVQLQTMKLQNDDNIGKTLHSIYQSSSSVIILLESNLNDDEEALLEVKLNEIAESTKSRLYCIDLKENGRYKGMNEIVEDTKSDISECISNVDCIQFSRFGQVLDDYGISCDYAEKECFDGCQLADKMFEVINAKSASIQHFWIELSKLKKKKYREKSLPLKRDIEKQIQQIRSQQLQHISHLPKMSSTMLNILYDLRDFPDKLMFFLKSLKLLLDKRSNKILPGLLSSLNDLSNDSKKAGREKNILEHQTKRIKIEIEDASFGVEHLMREVAHIFEALLYASDKEWCNVNVLECVKNCPSIAANLLIEGYPLEVMDGAASDGPLVWIKEVFMCLKSKIGSTTKLLTLSIMGIQSSGKSTLLNAMFGLQLAVSTGRCTKGVFLQLIPMPKDQFSFEYVLVFDTEGLRSNENRESSVTHVHDNQLATFVTGIADITLINIRGENLSEVSDILEIVVHAFIRMKKVNENFELEQSCIFVHQDVSDINAERNLRPGTLKLVKCLDEITNEAAEQEHLLNCDSFDKIIHFNHNKHVFYFPNLWLGSPPFCAINTDYSEKVDRLRHFIMSDINERRQTFFSVDEIWTKINDLWEAILSEDFVFSFKNGIELKAERTSESKFFELQRKLEITVSQFLIIDAESAFRNCENEDNLLDVKFKVKNQLNEKLSASYENLKKEWTDFIENAPLRDIIIQWKQNRLNQLEIYKNEQEVFAVKEINMMESRTRLEIRQRIILTPKEKEDWKYHANDVVEKCNEHPLDNDIKAAFKKLWSTDLSRFDTDSNREFSIDDEIWKIVLHYFQNDTLYLRNEQETFERQRRVLTFKQLQKPKECFKEIDITEIHLSGDKDKFETNRKIALTMANNIFSEIDTLVDDRKNKRFNIVEIREIFDKFSQNYHKCAIEARDHDFSLTKNFKAMLAVFIAKYLVAFYDRRHDEFEKNSGLETKRKEYEATLLNYFRKIISEAMKLKHEKIRKRKEEEEERKIAEEEERLRQQEEIKIQKFQAEAKMKAEKEQNDLEIETKKRQMKEEERKRIHQEKLLYEEQENTKKLDLEIQAEKQRREENERILRQEQEEIKRQKFQAEAKMKAEKEQNDLEIETKKRQMKEEERKRIHQEKLLYEEQENTKKLDLEIQAEKQRREENERILRQEQEEIKRQKFQAEAKMKAEKEQNDLEIETKKRQMKEEERKRIHQEKLLYEQQENTKKLDLEIQAEKQRREENERILRQEQEEIKRQKFQAEAKMKAEKEQNDLEIETKKRQMKEEERKRIHQEKLLYEEQENTKKLDLEIQAEKQRREEHERILRQEQEEIKRQKFQAEAKMKAEKEQNDLEIESKKRQMKEEERKRIHQEKLLYEEQENTKKLYLKIHAEKQRREENERILIKEQEEIKRQKFQAEAKMKAEKEQNDLEIETKKRQMKEEERKRIHQEKLLYEEQENTKKLDLKIQAEKQRREEKERILIKEQEEIKRQKFQAEAKMKNEKEQNELEIEAKKRQFDMEMNIKRKQTEHLMKAEERKKIQQEKQFDEEQENTKKLDEKIKAEKQRREEQERLLREEDYKELQVKLKAERQRKEREQDRSTALLITNIIKETLTSHVFSNVQSEIVTKILKQFKNSKHKLIKFMLRDLAENEVFDDFYSYIHSTTSYAKEYIEKYTDKKIFTDGKLYFEIAETHVCTLIDLTKMAVKDVINVSNMDEWSTQITDKFKYITLECLLSVRYIHVSNFENLTNFIIDDLKNKKDSLIYHYQNSSRNSVNWNTPTPYAEILDKLWGCEECCPLCSEPCENTTKHHGGVHECLHHKLNGVSGWHVVDTNVLCIHTCEENVASDGTFYCNRNKLSCQEDPNHIIHEYRSYKTYDPAWYIDPDNGLSSKYWHWYLCRFEEEIKNKYKVKYPMLENDWKNISKQDAIESLSKKKKANKW